MPALMSTVRKRSMLAAGDISKNDSEPRLHWAKWAFSTTWRQGSAKYNQTRRNQKRQKEKKHLHFYPLLDGQTGDIIAHDESTTHKILAPAKRNS